MLFVDISKNTRKVIFENTKTRSNDKETNEEKNGINDEKDKNMQVMNVYHGEASSLTVENTKNQRKYIMNMSQGEKSKLTKKNQAVSTVRSTVGPIRWSFDHMETYAEVLKYGKVKKNT